MPWRELPHTADLRLEIQAADWPALLREALCALTANLGEVEADAPAIERPLQLTALDREELLVRWLNEALVWCELDGLLPVDARFDAIADNELAAVVTLRPVRHRRRYIKAATYHELAIEPHAGGLRVRVLLDT